MSLRGVVKVAKRSTTVPAVAVVCGSTTSIGDAVVQSLHARHSTVITIDPEGTLSHPLATFRHTGSLRDESVWARIASAVASHTTAPTMLVHTLASYNAHAVPGNISTDTWHDILANTLCSAELFCHYLLPVMSSHGGAVVLLASVLGGWDHHPEAAAVSASSQAMLALMRTLAISGGARQIRVNAVCSGLLVQADDPEPDGVFQQALGRIPLAHPTRPADVAEAVLFLLGADAGYITGSSLVVDGGQTLQSWSNAPDEDYYPRGG